MKRQSPSLFYAIADPCGRDDLDPAALGASLLEGGARWIQLRWKGAPTARLVEAARELRQLTRRAGARLIINDRIDVALAIDADGAHLGQADLPLTEARRQLGSGRIIGISTHDRRQARDAEDGGADYIGFGPLFGTATKETGYAARGLERLRGIRQEVSLPIVAIGGIRDENAISALDAGADAVAMISAIVLADDVAGRVRRLLTLLRR